MHIQPIYDMKYINEHINEIDKTIK